MDQENDGWDHRDWFGITWKYPMYSGVNDAVYIRKVGRIWEMDSGFNGNAWMFEPMEGVKTLEEAKAVALMVYKMR
jgi:hypothetical protein